MVEGIVKTEPPLTLHFRAKRYRQNQKECRNQMDRYCSSYVGDLGILAKRADNLVHLTNIKITG